MRGAYGLFFNAVPQVAVSNNLVQQPFSRSVTVNRTPNLVCPFGGSVPPCPAGTPAGTDPFPYTPSTTNAVFLSGANLFGLPPDEYHIPSVQMFSLGFQQQYSLAGALKSTMSAMSAVTSRSPPTWMRRSTCQPTEGYLHGHGQYKQPSTLSADTYALHLRQHLGCRTTRYHLDNSLQATIQRRFDHHFSLQASYVWSKVISFIGNPYLSPNRSRSQRSRNTSTLPLLLCRPQVSPTAMPSSTFCSGRAT